MSLDLDGPSAARADGPAPPPEAALDSLPLAAVDTLLAFSDAVAHTTRPDDLLQKTVDTAAELLGLPWGILMLRDPDTRDLWLVATHGVPMRELPPVLQTPQESHVHPALFSGGVLVLPDYQGGPPLSPVWWEPAARLGLRAVVAVPLVAAGTYLGSLHVGAPVPHAFTPVEIALLERLARLAAQLLIHMRNLSAMEQRAGAFETMQEVARSLEATLDLDTVLSILMERAVTLVGASGGGLFLWDDAEGCLILRKAINLPALLPSRIASGEGVTGAAYATGALQIQNSYQQFADAIPNARQERVTNALVVPLLRQGRPIGTMSVFSQVFKPFTAEDAHLLTLFASQATVAIDSQLLYTAVARQQRQLDSIIQALHDGLVVSDRAGRVILMNRAAEEMLGVTTSMVGVDRAVIAQDPARYIRYQVEFLHDRARTIALVLERGVTLAGMARIHGPTVCTVEAFYTPYIDEAGAVAGVIALFRDMSTTEELERLRAALELARQHEDFLSIASHELRTPVAAIKGFSDLLSRRLAPGAPVTARDMAMLGSLSGQVGRLVALIDDLLDVARIQADKISFHWDSCSLAGVVRAAVESVRALAGPREDDLVGTGGDAPVRADPARLEQVFVNLLTNALKYSTTGPITCTLTVTEAAARVAVRDEGAGIAPGDLPHVFDRFFRSHDVYSHQRGLGLGLYISREIVERHKGRLWVESSPGAGSTFYVELPVLDAAGSTAPEANPAGAP